MHIRSSKIFNIFLCFFVYQGDKENDERATPKVIKVRHKKRKQKLRKSKKVIYIITQYP